MMNDDDDLNVSRGKYAFLHALLQSFTVVNLAVSTNVWSSLIKRYRQKVFALRVYIYLRYFLIVDILSPV